MPLPGDGTRPKSHDVGQQLKGAGPRQIDTETLQHLARFLQSSEPPITNIASLETGGAAWKRTRPRSPRRKRWSVQSLRIGKTAKHKKQAQSRLSRDVIGYPYNLVHTALAGEKQELIDLDSARKKLQHRSSAPPRPPRPSRIIEPGWPLRTSSMQGPPPQPSSPSFKIDPERLLLKPDAGDRLSAGAADSPRVSRASYLWMYGDVLRFLNTSPSTEKDDPLSGARLPLVDQAGGLPPVQEPKPAEAFPIASKQPTTENQQLPMPIETSSPSLTPPRLHLRTASRAGSGSLTNNSKLSDPNTSKPLPSLRPFPPKSTASATPSVMLTHDKSSPTLTSRFSPTSSQPRSPVKKITKPAHLALMANSSLKVNTPAPMPDSPGFPAMLGAMTFPSPPESSSSPLSIRSSPSSPDLASSLPGSPLAIHSSEPTSQVKLNVVKTAASYPNLATIEPQGRPENEYKRSTDLEGNQPLLQHLEGTAIAKSTGPFASHSTPGSNGGPSAFGQIPSSTILSVADQTSWTSASQPGVSTDDGISTSEKTHPSGSQRLESTAPTQSVVSGDAGHDYTTTGGRLETQSDRAELTPSLTSKADRSSSIADTSESNTLSGSRSHTPTSTSTLADVSKPVQNLAERRMARKAKVKALIEKRASVHKVQNLQLNLATYSSESVDSPVLGWFGPHAPKAQDNADTSSQHPLAGEIIITPKELVEETTSVENPSPKASRLRGHASQKSNGGASSKSESSRAFHSAQSSESSMCSFITASMNGGDSGEIEKEKPRSGTPELTLSSVMVMVNLTNSPPRSQRPQTVASFPSEPTPKQAKRASALRPLSLLTLDTSPKTTNTTTPSPPHEQKTTVRHRPIPIRVSRDTPQRSASSSTRRSNRKSFPSVITPPLSPDLLSPSSRSSQAWGAVRASRIEESSELNPLDMVPKKPDVTPMTREEETEFLKNYQQETARAWRLAALRKRIGSGRADMENDILSLNHDTPPAAIPESESSETEACPSMNSEPELTESPAPQLKPKSSKRLRARENFPSSVHLFKHSRQDALGSIADFELRHAKNSDDWVSAMMPLLDNMNRMLRDMQQQKTSGGRGPGMKMTTGSMATL